jgi:hypothetical protein
MKIFIVIILSFIFVIVFVALILKWNVDRYHDPPDGTVYKYDDPDEELLEDLDRAIKSAILRDKLLKIENELKKSEK